MTIGEAQTIREDNLYIVNIDDYNRGYVVFKLIDHPFKLTEIDDICVKYGLVEIITKKFMCLILKQDCYDNR